MDIAARTPAVFPAVATTVSKIMLYLEDSDRDDLFSLVGKRTDRIPHNGYMELWLQRIAYPNNLGFLSKEHMCGLVDDEDAQSLWCNSWIEKDTVKSSIENYSIVDRTVLDDLPPDIQNQEFDAFWKEYG